MKKKVSKILTVWLCVVIFATVFSVAVLLNASAYTTHNPIYIDGNADFTPENGVTGGSGTQSDPYIIEGWEIRAISAKGIEIRNTDAYFIIRNCYVHYGKSYNNEGIYFYNITNGRVENTKSLNNWYGIYLWSSSYNSISNNDVLNNFYGIYTWSSRYNYISNNIVDSNSFLGIYLDCSSNNIISDNSASNDWGGIQLWSSRYNAIYKNTVNSNEWYGILLESSSNNIISDNNVNSNDRHVVYLEASHNNIICNNNISNNYGYDEYYGHGIWLERSRYNDIYNNNVLNNRYGVYLCGPPGHASNYNNIYHNNFIDNVHQAYDNGVNQWDDGYPSGGNYWSDYTGVDEKSGPNQDQPGSDGIGDTPYDIPGGTNIDRYPLMSPWGEGPWPWS